jgi:hypothetical protein
VSNTRAFKKLLKEYIECCFDENDLHSLMSEDLSPARQRRRGDKIETIIESLYEKEQI